MLGALRPETGAELERKVDRDLPAVLDSLDCLGQGASFVRRANSSATNIFPRLETLLLSDSGFANA